MSLTRMFVILALACFLATRSTSANRSIFF
jgi:hypothetical protein